MSHILSRWAELGQRLHARPDVRRPDWAPAGRLSAVARHLFEAQAGRVRMLLAKSGKKLAPLGDPLTTDFGLHRWLAEGREEAYSDWLQWLLLQLDDPDEVCRLFRVGEVPSLTGWQEGPPSVGRELPVPQGHEARTGRLDLAVRYEGRALFVLEIKRADAEQADTAKQAGYCLWLDAQPEPNKYPILIATSAEEELYEGFRFLSWGDLCLGLRSLARRLYAANRLMIAAMTLAFVGAVEHNLLRFSLPRGVIGATLTTNRLAAYLERWLSECDA